MSTLTTNHRDRLAQVRERTRNARKRIADTRSSIEAARGVGDAGVEQTLTPALYAAENELEIASALEMQLLKQVAGISGGMGSESFLDEPATVRALEALATTSRPMTNVPLGPAMGAEELVDMIESGSWGPQRRAAADGLVPDTPIGRRGPWSELGVVRQLRRRIRLLDLIPTQQMAGDTVPYTIESGSFDNAAETPENAVKPAADLGLADGEARARTIANYIKAPRQILADVPSLAQTVQDRLTYSVLRRLENQIVAGDGTGENIRGITKTTGVADVPFVPDTPAADLILAGITAVEISNAEPDFVLMHPTTAQSMLTVKASGSGEYLSVDSPFGPEPTALWGLPFIESTVMPLGKALVGSLQQGASLWVRQGVFIIVGLDSDDLTRNRVTMLGEMRAAVVIQQPTAFAVVNVAAPDGGSSGAS